MLAETLDDIIASKEAAGRERDVAILPVLKKTRAAIEHPAAPAANGDRRRKR